MRVGGGLCVCFDTCCLQCCCCGFIQKEAFFDIISDKRKGMSLHIYWFWSFFVSSHRSEFNSTAAHIWSALRQACAALRDQRNQQLLNLRLARDCSFHTNHDYCHSLPLQPTSSYPFCSSLTTSFHLLTHAASTSTMYLQDLKWTEQLLSVMLILQIMIKSWSSFFRLPSHPACSGELTAVTNLCFIISWPV